MSDPTPKRDFLAQFFDYAHLPEEKQAVSKPFGDLAQRLLETLPSNPERTVALRKLLEAKDCAVRASFAKMGLMLAAILSIAFYAAPAAAQTVLGNPAPAAPPTPNWVTAILQYLVVPLLPVIGTMVLALLGKLTLFLHQKGKTSKTAEAFAVATDFFSTALSHIRAGIEPDLKAALADGTLDATERASLKAKILALVKAELPASVTGLLSGVLGPALETWLSGRAEQVIDQAAASSAALVATPAAVPS